MKTSDSQVLAFFFVERGLPAQEHFALRAHLRARAPALPVLSGLVPTPTGLLGQSSIKLRSGMTNRKIARLRFCEALLYSSGDGFARKRLICERRDFSSSVRFLALRDMRVGTRLAGR